MTITVSQDILDALTDVEMPRLPPARHISGQLEVSGYTLPILRCECVIVGSGAAGLRAAVELKRRGVDVVVITQSAFGGTSACSGSDKQTLHTANTADRGDNYQAMARAIRGGGAMDEDTAYVEAVGSPRAMASLQYMGLPLPQDALGGTLRYKTDHDEAGRATSCGPRTSRLMVKVLAEEAIQLGIPIYNQTTAVKILVDKAGQRVSGLLAIRPSEASGTNPFGYVSIESSTLVIAAGGPGELYRDSVYPNGCFGSLGLALDAGIQMVNLTESQFGIGTRREGFPWNLSGTYVQVIPHIYSMDKLGNEHHFLAEYYRTTQEMASNIFRKGYQWPFHSTRMLNFGSSLVDLAIYKESELGRRVFMDFNRNPLPVLGDVEFSLDRLDDDVSTYLRNAGAVQESPIDRLKHMNPLSIELYRRYKVDIVTEPLEFAVNNQHMNGGIAVDTWGRSSLSGCYAIGEAAGTHGVTRPGGAALNAGQVLGTRVAEQLAARLRTNPSRADGLMHIVEEAVTDLGKILQSSSSLSVRLVKKEIQSRMSDRAGIMCHGTSVAEALGEAKALNAKISASGISFQRPAEAVRAIQWWQMSLASEAVLMALDYFIGMGGGSRGARTICDPDGECVPVTRNGALEIYRFRKEQEVHKAEQICVTLQGGKFTISTKPNRKFDEAAKNFFERDWPAWLTGQIYNLNVSR